MKNRKSVAFLVLAAAASLTLTGCFGFGEKKEEEVVVEESTFPEVEEKETELTPTPVPTEAPVQKASVYLSRNKMISIQLPDNTWANKTDEDHLLTFESADQGSILITVTSEEEREELALPDTEQNAIAIEEEAQLTSGKDFELTGYQADVGEDGNAVYSYQMNMLDPTASGYANILVKVYANDTDAVQIRGTVKSGDADVLAKIKDAVDSVALGETSSLHALAPMPEKIAAAGDGTVVEGIGTEKTEEGKDADGEVQESAEETAGITPSRDNPNNSDPNLTRTIYRNSDGYPIVISADGNGGWIDEDGNKYRFEENEIDVYDQDDVDYYWHGEAADVYYMPVNTEDTEE